MTSDADPFGSTSSWLDEPPYGLSNYERRRANGQRVTRRGNAVTYTLLTDDSATRKSDPEDSGFRPVPAKGALNIDVTLDEGVWVKEEQRASVRIILPQLDIGGQKFRVIGYLQHASADAKDWRVTRQEVLPLTAQALAAIIDTAEANYVTRVFASVWLTDVDRTAAVPVLVRAASPLRGGELLAACLRLLARIGDPSLGEKALSLLAEKEAPNGIRRLSALYLGEIHLGSALDALSEAARDEDKTVSTAAVDALGTFGGDHAADVLLGLLRDRGLGDRERRTATATARAGNTKTLAVLQEMAVERKVVLDALADSGRSELFPFFEQRLRLAERREEWRVAQLRGLRLSGGPRAVPLLLGLLRVEGPPAASAPTTTAPVVDALIALNAAEAVGELEHLAEAEHLPALQTLAGMKQFAARDALLRRATGAQGPALRIIVKGLSDHWASDGVPVFVASLISGDSDTLQAGLVGLRRSADSTQSPAIIPFLSHPESKVRWEAASAIRALGPGAETARLLAIIVDHTDEVVVNRLVSALIDAPWKDSRSVPLLAQHLADRAGDIRFHMIRLMQQVAGASMGPKDLSEFQRTPGEWVRKWSEWADTVR